MRVKNFELWVSALTIAVITAVYISIVQYTTIPPASSLFGHSLGIAGFILMLMTEILYSVRKRYQFARWGKLQNWLSFHIFTGLVGPYLVLLHTSWKFQGLAGVLTLMTLIIVASGFIGRYFYTEIPRDDEGKALEALQVEELIEKNSLEIKALEIERQKRMESADSIHPQNQPDHPIQNSALRQSPDNTESGKELQLLMARQAQLHRQLLRLERTRKLLAIWHTIHVPVALSVFLVAVVHIFAALYYATLLH